MAGVAAARDDLGQPRAKRRRRHPTVLQVVPCSSEPSFAESPCDDRRASGTELAEAHRLGKRSDRFAVARPAEQHGEVDADVALLQLVQPGSDRIARAGACSITRATAPGGLLAGTS